MFVKILIYLATIVGAIVFSGLFIVLFGNSLQVHCARPAGENATCKISKALLGRYPLTSRTVTDIVKVKEDDSCDPDCSYRALLISSSGESVPVNDVYTDQGPVVEQIDAINAFLGGQTDTFEYAEDTPWWVVELSAGLGLMIIVILTVNFITRLVKG
jgi:hypothetical protein